MLELLQKSPMLRRIEDELAIGEDDFICRYGSSDREGSIHHWIYDGPLEDVISWFLESFDGTAEHDLDYGWVRVDSRINTALKSSKGPNREQTWRYHLGSVLLNGEPSADLAMPGETLADLQGLLAGYFAAEDETSPELQLLQARWNAVVQYYETTHVNMSDWVEELCSRG